MRNSGPTDRKPSGTRELGKGCGIPPVFSPGVTSPRGRGLRRLRVLPRWQPHRQKRFLGAQAASRPTRIQYFGPEGPNSFGMYSIASFRGRVAGKRNTYPRLWGSYVAERWLSWPDDSTARDPIY